MIDEYNIKRYIPKKYHPCIYNIRVECEGDNRSNGSHLVYIIDFVSGNSIYVVGTKNIVKEIKRYLEGLI